MQLVIIGNGVAGVTTARYVRKNSDMKIMVISAESDHFFSRTALMYIYMGHMRYQDTKPYEDRFWNENRIDLVRGYVKTVDTDHKKVVLGDGRSFNYDHLVIASGSNSNKFGWPGQDLPGVQGLYSLQDLELLEENTNNISRAVIVGGGLIGIELAEMMHSRKIPVTMLVREKNFWDLVLPLEEAQLVNRHIREHGIDLRLETELEKIVAGPDGRVASVLTNAKDHISCRFVGLTVGVHPNIAWLKDTKIEIGRGILVNRYLETNIPDVYAAGDCAEIKAEREGEQNRVEQLWYTARMQGEILAKTICGSRIRYDRGIWFNSAKFFEIEYQTYGFVPNQPVPGEQSFYWEHADGEHCLRIVFDQKSGVVKGFNTFGIRFRQSVCHNWIRERQTIEYVLTHLEEINFDPEFFKTYESEIRERYSSLSRTI